MGKWEQAVELGNGIRNGTTKKGRQAGYSKVGDDEGRGNSGGREQDRTNIPRRSRTSNPSPSPSPRPPSARPRRTRILRRRRRIERQEARQLAQILPILFFPLYTFTPNTLYPIYSTFFTAFTFTITQSTNITFFASYVDGGLVVLHLLQQRDEIERVAAVRRRGRRELEHRRRGQLVGGVDVHVDLHSDAFRIAAFPCSVGVVTGGGRIVIVVIASGCKRSRRGRRGGRGGRHSGRRRGREQARGEERRVARVDGRRPPVRTCIHIIIMVVGVRI